LGRVAPLIYLFEDDQSLRELLTEVLREELGSDVEPYSTLTSLQERCAAQVPSLVIADFWGTSHLHLSDTERSEINSLAALAPLVLVSARAWMLDADSSDLGLVALMPKPLDMEDFVGMLRQALDSALRPSGEGPGADGVSGDGVSGDGVSGRADGEQADSLPPRETLSVFVLGWP
jgi:DNA-binding NtrC family response regulator